MLQLSEEVLERGEIDPPFEFTTTGAEVAGIPPDAGPARFWAPSDVVLPVGAAPVIVASSVTSVDRDRSAEGQMLNTQRCCGRVADLSALATWACARRSRGPEQKTLRREFTSACRTSARCGLWLARVGREDRRAQAAGRAWGTGRQEMLSWDVGGQLRFRAVARSDPAIPGQDQRSPFVLPPSASPLETKPRRHSCAERPGRSGIG